MLPAICVTLFLISIALHCFCRAKFHDYQFAERDSYGNWGKADYVPNTLYEFEVKKWNQKWHKWLWAMIITLFAAMFFITSSAIQNPSSEVYGWMLVGCGLYCVLIDPFISLISLEQNFFYISDTDKVKVRRFRLLRKNPNLLSFLLRCTLLILTLLVKIFIL